MIPSEGAVFRRNLSLLTSAATGRMEFPDTLLAIHARQFGADENAIVAAIGVDGRRPRLPRGEAPPRQLARDAAQPALQLPPIKMAKLLHVHVKAWCAARRRR